MLAVEVKCKISIYVGIVLPIRLYEKIIFHLLKEQLFVLKNFSLQVALALFFQVSNATSEIYVKYLKNVKDNEAEKFT